jgi:opacity protein-like surface antigen
MRKGVALLAASLLLSAAPAWAQTKRVEVSGVIGWTFSDGVSGDPFRALDGNTYDRLDPKDSFNWGLLFGINASDNVEVGFMFNQQMSTLQAGGTATTDVGDMKVNGYHGYFAYNFGDPEGKLRPYVLGGIGATNYGSVSFTRVNGVTGETASHTQFSTTWGAGVKFFASPNVGARFGVRWTPTYIKSDSEGWWCDPYWGCYVVGSAQYSNQFDFSGGVTFRF